MRSSAAGKEHSPGETWNPEPPPKYSAFLQFHCRAIAPRHSPCTYSCKPTRRGGPACTARLGRGQTADPLREGSYEPLLDDLPIPRSCDHAAGGMPWSVSPGVPVAQAPRDSALQNHPPLVTCPPTSVSPASCTRLGHRPDHPPGLVSARCRAPFPLFYLFYLLFPGGSTSWASSCSTPPTH
jgi:hypothetical protein